MLEFALKQERNKYSKLKYGGDGTDIGPPPQVKCQEMKRALKSKGLRIFYASNNIFK